MIPVPRDPSAAADRAAADARAPEPTSANSTSAESTSADSTTGWALAARSGDPVAQAAFVRATQPEVWRFTAALVDPDSADDLTQETYLRAFRALPAFEGRSSARTWLLGIARRACADHLRTVVRRRRLDQRLTAHAHIDVPHPDPAGQLGAADLVRRLAAERRGAFVLTQLLGLSYAEAAAVEGVPVGTIRSRVARARAELVDAVGEALAG
ncbi:RNA polymerase sigma-70 factor, ECF subfamily [Micromonospora phaseoli]|uniref:RNA polymerase sigma factor n=1 Tax=Micromonospora phaseoli TaxID=1144548 RepID=A0A1H7CTL1_9ACTN|nr:sigma-70 family RNA polymerase sigma factor [Micromonospora phaseoli]PZV91504.1 RNA polymerase sigma-70 factor (ECF subfamily) [Micromonospora phaseoli]GIJ80089.1 RNA polymerase sigma factor [Micromonospora phaseoli]SEJ93008.1 RNA polymerase sigma-70 factor, ECF subfamily [Micromonospora phaseoli]